MLFVVHANGGYCVAKVYKDAAHRSFRHRAGYAEGRRVRNSRQRRAMEKGTKYGKAQLETAWQNAEVDALYRLSEAGVRVPKPHLYSEGVLLMDLIRTPRGFRAAAGRRGSHRGAGLEVHQFLVHQVVLMLCDGPGARRPVRVQRAPRVGRPGDHRPAAGSRSSADANRARRCCRVTSATCATSSADSRRNYSKPTTARRSEHYERGELTPETNSPAASCRNTRRDRPRERDARSRRRAGRRKFPAPAASRSDRASGPVNTWIAHAPCLRGPRSRRGDRPVPRQGEEPQQRCAARQGPARRVILQNARTRRCAALTGSCPAGGSAPRLRPFWRSRMCDPSVNRPSPRRAMVTRTEASSIAATPCRTLRAR